MTDNTKPLRIVIAPGAFDNFDGTQEELDEMLAFLQDVVSQGPEALAAASMPLTPEEQEELRAILDQPSNTRQ